MSTLTKKPSIPADNNKTGLSQTEENGLSGFIWRTFVGNKKKEDFYKSSIILLILINGILVFFLYSQKTQKSVYVIDGGVPKVANLVSNDVRVDEQVVFFIKLWARLLTEVTSDNYEQNRKTLKTISSRDLMKRVLTAESASSNRLIKEVMQAESMHLKIVDIVIDKITRHGSFIDVKFSEIVQIDLSSGSERYVTTHQAKLITTNYNLNGIGLAMIEMDNLWKLGRRI